MTITSSITSALSSIRSYAPQNHGTEPPEVEEAGIDAGLVILIALISAGCSGLASLLPQAGGEVADGGGSDADVDTDSDRDIDGEIDREIDADAEWEADKDAYPCTITSGWHEICDSIDNDCDHEIDENCSNLVLYLSLDESVGTIAHDRSLYGNNGTLNGAGVMWGSGAVSGALWFMEDGYVEIPNSPGLNFDNNFTIMFWLWNDAQERHSGVISHGRVCAHPVRSWNMVTHRDNQNRLSFAYTQDGTDTTRRLYDTSEFEEVTWQQIAFTFESGTGIFYLNGEVNSEAIHEAVPVFVNNWNILIGRSHCPVDDPNLSFLYGQLDEIAIYNRVLSSVEIENYYRQMSSHGE